jgi:type IV pilus assembly protein PilP
MIKAHFCSFLVGCSFALVGCGPSGEDELRMWTAEQRATTKPSVQPLTEPKKIHPGTLHTRRRSGAVQSN